MKTLNKTKLILLLITITFLSGINKVGAITCQYKLPFSGINATTGDYIEYDSEFKCFATENSAKNCSYDAYISSSLVDKENVTCKEKGKDKVYIYVNNYSISWGLEGADGRRLLYDSTNAEFPLSDVTSCPKYIVVSNRDIQSSIDNLSAIMKEAFIDSKDKCENNANNPNFQILTTKQDAGTCNTTGLNLHIKSCNPDEHTSQTLLSYTGYNDDYDQKYREYLSNFYDAPSARSLDVLDTNLTLILPLYDGVDTPDNEGDEKKALAITDIYRDVVGTAWTNQLNKHRENLKNSCGNDYEKYINLNNYTSELTGDHGSKSQSQQLIDYSIQPYNTSILLKNDAGMSESCWNARSDFMKMFRTFRVFMYNIGVTKKGQTKNNENIYFKAFYDDTTKDFDDNKVYDWIMMQYFFEAVNWGTEQRLENYTSDNEEVNEKLADTEEAKRAKYVMDTFNEDRCAHICFSSPENLTLDQFKADYSTSCKMYNEMYDTCRNALYTCNGNYNCSNYTGDAKTSCESSYASRLNNDEFNSCMNNYIPNFSVNSKAAYENAKKKYETALTAYNTQRRTFGFVKAGLPSIDYNFAKYTPKCSDVKIFTEIWQVLKIVAPFLIIIFGSLDYFKAVIAGDMEAMKKAKSKFPKRLIAFLLLIIVPFVVNEIMKAGSNGAEDTSYFRCIITGDKGDDN